MEALPGRDEVVAALDLAHLDPSVLDEFELPGVERHDELVLGWLLGHEPDRKHRLNTWVCVPGL